MKRFILFIATAFASVSCANASDVDEVKSVETTSTEVLTQEVADVENTTPVVEVDTEITNNDVDTSATSNVGNAENIEVANGVIAVENLTIEHEDVVEPEAIEADASPMLVEEVETPLAENLETEGVSTEVVESSDATPIAVVESAENVEIAEVEVAEDAEEETSARFLPTRYRVDRNIGVNKFVYKGEFMLGLTASYGNLSSDDTDIMLLFDNINLGLRSATVKPFFAYAYRDNLAVGVRFGYEYISGEVGSLDLNLGLIADMENMGLSNLALRNENFSWSIFHRNYIGLDRRGTVGVIMEAELLCKTGSTSIWNGEGDGLTRSDSRNFAARLNFNPGLAIYVMPQVCVTVTVGVGGLYYNNIRQYDALGNALGRRDRSGLSLKLNLADIQVGIVAHLWNAKKK